MGHCVPFLPRYFFPQFVLLADSEELDYKSVFRVNFLSSPGPYFLVSLSPVWITEGTFERFFTK